MSAGMTWLQLNEENSLLLGLAEEARLLVLGSHWERKLARLLLILWFCQKHGKT